MMRSFAHARPRRASGGWLLIEVALMLALISTFLIIEARLFVGIVRMWQQVRDGETQMVQFDHAMRLLRADAWGAAEFEVRDDGRVLVVRQADATITWRAEPRLARDLAGQVRTWSDPGQDVRFKAGEAGLMVTTRSLAGEEAGLLLPSQVLLAEVSR